MIGQGPIDLWEVELGRASRSGLVALVERMAIAFGLDREERLNLAKFARREGLYADTSARMQRLIASPGREMDRILRKREAAKKAARRRKRAAR